MTACSFFIFAHSLSPRLFLFFLIFFIVLVLLNIRNLFSDLYFWDTNTIKTFGSKLNLVILWNEGFALKEWVCWVDRVVLS